MAVHEIDSCKISYISAQNLSVGYNGRSVVSDINLDVRRGEIITLIGPNGAGKSTILKTLTRQLSAVGGVVVLDGKNLAQMSAKDLAARMSVVLTQRIEPELMTCRDVVATGRYPYTNYFGRLTDEDEKIVDESLAKVNGEALSEQNFDSVSDGQRQRIMLARALCQQPDIMILDEPTSYLDIRYKVDFMNILRNMANEGITVIISLHEIDLAHRLSDRIMCVRGNDMLTVGTPEEIFADSTIEQLFDLDAGAYDSRFGIVELQKPVGTPEILVVGGNGSGISVYHSLQRKGKSFYAGLLYENDCDLPYARALASEVVVEKAFMPVSEKNISRMYEILEKVSAVIDCGCVHGDFDKINQKILDKARESGKLTGIDGV